MNPIPKTKAKTEEPIIIDKQALISLTADDSPSTLAASPKLYAVALAG